MSESWIQHGEYEIRKVAYTEIHFKRSNILIFLLIALFPHVYLFFINKIVLWDLRECGLALDYTDRCYMSTNNFMSRSLQVIEVG